MKTVNQNFKNNIKKYGRMLDAQITIGEAFIDKHDINSIIPTFNTSLFKTVMFGLEIDSNIAIPKNTNIDVKIGVRFESSTYDYLNFNGYKVSKNDRQEDTDSYKIIAYDRMKEAMIDYDMQVTYPISVKDYLILIFNKLSWDTSGIPAIFINSTKLIRQDIHSGIKYTYRDVLDELCTITGSFIYWKEGVPKLLYITETNEIIDEESLNQDNIVVGEKYLINSLVFSRAEDSDTIYRKDDASINTNGLYEFKIKDNQILSTNYRDDFIDELFTYLKTLNYYVYDIESPGIMYFEPADMFTISVNGNTYSTVILNDEITIDQDIQEKLYVEEPLESSTEYKYSDLTDRRIQQTNLIVDKQGQKIEALVQNVDIVTDTVAGIGDKDSVVSSNITIDSAKAPASITNLRGDFKQTTVEEVVGNTASGQMITVSDVDDTKEKYLLPLDGNSSQATTILPSGYTQVDYLQSDGNQYINTGFNPNNNTSLEIKASNITLVDFLALFGSRTGATNQFWNYAGANGGIISRYGTLSYQYATITNSQTFKLKQDKNQIYFNDSLIYSHATQTFTSTYPVFLFGVNDTGTKTYGMSGRIYYTKIWDNGILVRYMIPCKRNSDNVLGMYDIVNNIFYGNAGTGVFTTGTNTVLPNPEFPIDMNIVKPVNLYNPDAAFPIVSNGVTLTKNSDGSITLNGTASATANVTLGTIPYSIYKNWLYRRLYLSLVTTGIGAISVWGYGIKRSGGNVFPSITESVQSVLFYTRFTDDLQFVFAIQSGVTYSNYTIYPKLSLFSAMTDYSPYQSIGIKVSNNDNSQSTLYQLALGAKELPAINTYKSQIIEKWDGYYYRENIGKIVLDGITNSFNFRGVSNNQSFFRFNGSLWDSTTSIAIDTILYCSHFKASNSWGANTAYTKHATNGIAIQVMFSDTTFTTIADGNAWLQAQYNAGTPVIVYYVLSTPVDTKITDILLISQLNTFRNAPLYNGVTNITNNSIAILNLKYNFITPSPSPNKPSTIGEQTGNETISINDIVKFNIPLADKVMGGRETIYDELYLENGKLYYKKVWDKIILNGSETGWTDNTSWTPSWTTGLRRFSFTRSSLIVNYKEVICNHFKYYPYSGNELVGVFVGGGNSWHFNAYFSNLTEFEAWLTANPVTVFYQLATPVITEITDNNLIESFKSMQAIYLERGYNHFASDFIMAIEYYTNTDFNSKLSFIEDQAAIELLRTQTAQLKITQEEISSTVSSQEQTLDDITGELDTTKTNVTSLIETADTLTTNVDELINLTNLITNKSDTNILNLTETAKSTGMIKELKIKGFTTMSLYPGMSYPSNNTYPGILTTYCIIQDNNQTPSSNLVKSYFTISAPLRTLDLGNGNIIYDVLIIRDNTVYVERNIGLNASNAYIQIATVTENYEKLELNTFDTNSYIYMDLFTNLQYECTYMKSNIYTKEFATKLETKSGIDILKDNLLLYSKKDEVISSINLSPENIKIQAKNIDFEGTVTANENFIIDEEGTMSCDEANIKNANCENLNVKYSNIDTCDCKEINIVDSNFTNGKIELVDGTQDNSNLIVKNSIGSIESSITPGNLFLTGSSISIGMNSRDDGTGNRILFTVDPSVVPQVNLFTDDGVHTFILATGITTPNVTQTSKESTKKNIVEFDENALDILKQSKVYKYNLKFEEDTEKEHIGFVIPDEGGQFETPNQIISNDNEGIDIYSTIAILWKAVQEQQKTIEELKNIIGG